MTTEVVSAEGAAARSFAAPSSYRSSWADAIVSGLERLPGPTWLAYGLLVALGMLLIVVGGSAHRLGLSGLTPAYFAYVFFYVFPLAAYHFLTVGARRAWDAFRPSTSLEDAQAARLRLELSSTPWRPVAIIWITTAVLNTAWSLAAPELIDLNDQPPLYVVLRLAMESLWVAPVSIVLFYLVIRQLRRVVVLHRLVTRVDLLHPAPLRAISTLTARAAVVLVVLGVFSGLPLPGTSEEGWLVTLTVWTLPILILAAGAFVVPLRGLNRLLAEDKDRRLGVIAGHINAAGLELHRIANALQDEATGAASERLQVRADAATKTLSGLLQERDFIRHQPTWPWDGGTFRTVVSAVALPIALFLVTRLLERFI